MEEEQDWSEVESDVVHLTEETFNDAIQNSSALVMFYAPCKLRCDVTMCFLILFVKSSESLIT